MTLGRRPSNPDLFQAWAAWRRGNTADLYDPQRRLRWALDGLPDRVRRALPLVDELATADWDAFGEADPEEAERDISEEMRSVRTQVAQGLPVTRRWTINADLGQVSAGNRDAVSYLWQIERGDETRRIQVFISGTAMASGNDHLPREVAQAKETNRRSVVATLLGVDEPPEEVMVSTAGIGWPPPD